MIQFVSAVELAEKFGFNGPNDGFRAFCRQLGIQPIRRNPHYFDPIHVRARLDAAQGLEARQNGSEQERDLVEARRARRAAQ